MIIKDDDDGQRLDRFLKKAFPQLTFGDTQKLIRKGQVRINGGRVKPDTRLSKGDELRLPPSLQNGNDKPSIQFSQKDRDFITSITVYEDDDILALNKPAGLAVQGGSKTKRHIDGMLNSYMKKGVKPRLCHRLDKDTSGVLILGKTAAATRELTHAFQSHTIQKTYWAVTTGVPDQHDGTIDAPIGKNPVRSDGGEMMTHDPQNGKKAITDFEVIDHAGKDIALIAFYPQTGRTHQIRVHAALIDCPLLGDAKYNPTPNPFDMDGLYHGLHLHAQSIELRHPITKKPLVITAQLPDTIKNTLALFGLTR